MKGGGAARCAIVFHPEGYSIESQKIVGRRAAGVGFLHGVTRYGMQDALRCVCDTPEYFAQFVKEVHQAQADTVCRWIVPGQSDNMREVDCLYRPDCSIGHAAWLRRASS